jgi:hypothetical protein
MRFMGALLLVLIGAVTVMAAPANPTDIPLLRCPKLRTAPTIDGKLSPGEWQGAAGISAMVSACPAGGATPTIAPPIQQVTFYMAYDDKYLYLAMHSPHKEGTYPQARCKTNDYLWGVLSEDHIEFQINKNTRAQANTPGFGFYKMLVNPRGAMTDQWLNNGTVGSEELWSTGGQTKCTVTPTYWDMEISVELAQMKLDKLDGRSLVMWLCRADWCNGVYFLTWGPGYWMGWDTMPEVTFDPAAPAVQLANIGNIMDGNPDIVFNLADSTGKAHAITGSLKILNKAGQTICDEKASAELAVNGTARLNLTKTGVPIDETGNTVLLEVKEGETVLYYNKMPLARLTEAYRKNILESWLNGRPQSGDWDYGFAYRPGDGIAECSADLDFFGVSEKVLSADRCEVEILNAKGKTMAKDHFAITAKTGSALLKTPALPEGDYTARFTLFAGKKKIEKKEIAFVRKVFPWEKERLGISDEVVPPYEPITVVTNKASGAPTLNVWNRQYTIGGNGLPANIKHAWQVNLLRTPVRFEVNGAAAPTDSTAKPVLVVKAAGYESIVKGSQKFGDVVINTTATMEYDGWYDVTMDVSGAKAQGAGNMSATIHNLDLVLDLPAEFDTLYVHRNDDSSVGSYYGSIPAGTGTVWASTSLASFKDSLIPTKDWKSFAPVMFVGTGSRGLWFYAWSDKGWQLADGDAALRIERDAKTGAPTLRVRIIAGDATIDTPRKIRFALLAAPVKPLPEDYRNWKMSHDTCGYRYYGDSVDGYALPNDEAYEMERKRLLYGPQTDFAREWFSKRGWGVAMGRGAAFNNRPIVLYGSTQLTGAGMTEFDTFGGEWLGRTNWKGNVERGDVGKPNYSGSVLFDTDRKCTVVGTQFTPSYIDCFVWYHKKLIEKGVNGTWFDNSSIGLIKQYDPETGKMDSVFNQLSRREQMKRLTTVNWQLMRRPCWITNMHEDFSFSDVIWLVENDWYINGEGRDMFEHMSLDTFRAMACTKTMQLVAKPWINNPTPKDHPAYAHVLRSITTMLMAHDVQNFPLPDYQTLHDTQLGRWLNFHVNFEDGKACLFRGYWDTPATLVDTKDPDVKCSVYYNSRRKTAVLWFVNAGKEDKTLTGVTFSSDLIGRNNNCRVAFDAETGAPVPFAAASELNKIKAFILSEPLVIKKHEFRAIAIGAEE